MKAALFLLLLSAIVVAGCKITDPNESPATQPKLSIVPDTVYGNTTQWVGFSARWSDSVNHARYYFWDFGDSTTSTTYGVSTSHLYQRSGNYHIRVLALDTHDSVTASAQSLAHITQTPIQVTLDSDSYTLNQAGTYRFHATVSPSMYNVQYLWTLDNDTAISTQYESSVSFNFTATGQHTLRVDVRMNGEIVASDTATITVSYPSITADELAAMGTLEILAVEGSDTIHTTLALSNGFGNTYNRSGAAFTATHYATAHQSLPNGGALDSSDFKSAFWTLYGDRMLDTVGLVWIDSSRRGTDDTNTFIVRKATLESHQLFLLSASPTSVTFGCNSVPQFLLDVGTAVTPPVTPSQDRGCGSVSDIRLLLRSSIGTVRFIFYKPH